MEAFDPDCLNLVTTCRIAFRSKALDRALKVVARIRDEGLSLIHIYNDKVCFLILGAGTEYSKLERFLQEEHPSNVVLHQALPKAEYDQMIACCDVGMIFLDYRFTIPNFPSRLLSYLQVHLPVLAAVDSNTDVGKIIEENGFGNWCESRDPEDFSRCLEHFYDRKENKEMGERGRRYLEKSFTSEIGYQIIMKQVSRPKKSQGAAI